MAVLLGCSSSGDAPVTVDVGPRAEPVARARPPAGQPKPGPWTFAVLSDLHVPNYFDTTVERTVAALIAMKVRLVVITGDHTNGSPLDGPGRKDRWWATLRRVLEPLRAAGIPVLPVAGNHDSYLPVQRASYAATFDRSWARPLAIVDAGEGKLARWPFSYSVDVDGVHLALAHVVASKLDPAVARWLAADLESAPARAAHHRIAFGHVPVSSVIWSPSRVFVEQLGGILDRGKVEMYVGGHEHVVWDEDVALPGRTLRQVLAGCASGYYDYAPSEPSKIRARCVPVVRPGLREPMRCKMPNGGGAFEISRGRKNRHIQHYRNAFVLIDVDGPELRVRPMTVDAAGKPRSFYLAD